MASTIPAIKLGAVQAGGKGQKCIPVVSAEDGKAIYLSPGVLQVPYGASAYNDPDSQRLNLSFTPTEEFNAQITQLDEAIKAELKPRLQELFGSQADSVEQQYISPLKTSRMGLVGVRTKTNVGNYRQAVRCWDKGRNLMAIPQDWSAYAVSPRIWVKQLYILGKECGLILETVDALMEPLRYDCPF